MPVQMILCCAGDHSLCENFLLFNFAVSEDPKHHLLWWRRGVAVTSLGVPTKLLYFGPG